MAGMKPAILLAATLALGGCVNRTACEQPAAPAQAATPTAEDPRLALAQRAANDRLRARLREEAADPRRQRGVVVHRQAQPDSYAVCGQVNPTGRGDDPFMPFIAIITFDGLLPRVADFVVGATSAEATRAYVATLENCFAGGGQPAARNQRRVMPPLPDQDLTTLRPQPAPAPPPAPAAPAAASVPASGSVTVGQRSIANIRATPGGGGEVIRTVPRGASLEVFATAAGGWVQVGQQGAVWGWVHNSLLEPR